MRIGDRWVTTDETRDVENPATGEIVTAVPEAHQEHVDDVLAAAGAAQKEWSKRTLGERAEVIGAVIREVDRHAEELARIVVAEQGKTITEARGEIGGVKAFFDHAFAQRYRQVGEVVAAAGRQEQLLVREEPYGVVVAIIPWNFPAAIFARKVGPALMAGNAIVLKPSEVTPLAPLALARVCELAGVPAGLVNVVTGVGRTVGEGAGRAPDHRDGDRHRLDPRRPGDPRPGRRQDHPGVARARRQGAVPRLRGRRRRARRPPRRRGPALELRPGLHLQRADLRAPRRARRVRGAGGRAHARGARRRPARRGVPDGTEGVGPEWEKVKGFVDRAVEQGARSCSAAAGPRGTVRRGHWFAPTVLTGVRNDMEIVQNEVFGPVLPVVPFDSYDEVVEYANSTVYGFTAYVFTKDVTTAMRATTTSSSARCTSTRSGRRRCRASTPGGSSRASAATTASTGSSGTCAARRLRRIRGLTR